MKNYKPSEREKVNAKSNGTKKTLFNFLGSNSNEIKLVSQKPKHPSIKDINFNAYKSRNNFAAHGKKASLTESGIYEEINLEEVKAIENLKLKSEPDKDNFKPTKYNEDDESTNYESDIEETTQTDKTLPMKSKDNYHDLNTVPSLPKNNRGLYTPQLKTLSEHSNTPSISSYANNDEIYNDNKNHSISADHLETKNFSSLNNQSPNFNDEKLFKKKTSIKKSGSFSGVDNHRPRTKSLMFNHLDSDSKVSSDHRNSINQKLSNESPGYNLNVKRRTIIDVIKHIGEHDKTENSKYSNDDESPQDSEIPHSNKFIDTIQPKIDFEDIEQNKKPTPHRPKSAVGIGVIYGLFLLLFGIFFSLDTLTGKIGMNPLIHSIFIILVYLVSIGWILFLFFDVHRYVNKLNDFMENNYDCEKDAIEIVRSKTNRDFYSVVNSKTGQHTKVYDTQDVLKNIREKNYIYLAQNSNQVPDLRTELIDFTSKDFRGYLVDNVQPYNMYLKGGIGVFCLFSIVQSSIEIAEQTENFANYKDVPQCKLTNYSMSLIISALQLTFSSLQFLFIFLRGNIVISTRNILSSILTIHVAVNNILVWYNNILNETLSEYYLHVLKVNFEKLNEQASEFSVLENRNFTDCYDPNKLTIQQFAVDLKPYLYPATIEFSITCATIFGIMWNKIGKKHLSYYTLPPTKKHFKDVGTISMPPTNLFIMLDCTKTSKGLFFGILIFAGTLFSYILFIVYKSTNPERSSLIIEITELILLSIALLISVIAFAKVIKNYSKAIPVVNMFDVALEILSLCGIYAYSFNSLLAIISTLNSSESLPTVSIDDFISSFNNNTSTESPLNDEQPEAAFSYIEVANRIVSLVQSTIQTLFILECLRRYADQNKPFLRKPARELITALLIVNVTLWFFDTFSAKRFDTKPFLTEHFGEIKWSIINAFSSPLAIFYRFHSSVCLSDIWYGLYYGENEIEERENL